MSSLLVVARIKAKPGQEKRVQTLLETMVKETHKEPGCLTYALHHAATEPGTFVFIEKWASEKDLQAHLAAPHIAKAMAIKDEIIDVLEILPLAPVPGGSLEKSRV